MTGEPAVGVFLPIKAKHKTFASRIGLRWFPLATAFAIGLLASTGAIAGWDWQVRSSMSFYTGNYGSATDADMVFLTAGVKRYFPSGDISASVPFIGLRNSGEDTSTEMGLGDVIFKGKYYLVPQAGFRPGLDIVGKIKLPTASESQDLGTGEFDAGVGIESSYELKNGHLLFADAEYTLIGDSPGYDYDNRVVLDVGYGYPWSDDTLVSVFVEHRSAIVRSSEDSRSIMLFVDHRLLRNVHADLLVELGLSDGAADLGMAVGLRFYM